MVKKINSFDLNGSWNVSFQDPRTSRPVTIPATIPGNIELDLLKAGLIGDPIPQTEEHAERWIDTTDFTFSRTFSYSGLPEGASCAILDFEGIDTIAQVFLNGELILDCANMHIAHKADVTDKLKIGENSLDVAIQSPEIAARKFNPPPFRATPREATIYLRKARHSWGWDNAPHRLTAGIWRDVSLQFLPPVRINDVYAFTSYIDKEPDQAEINCCYSFTTPDRSLEDYTIHIQMFFHGECELDRQFAALHTTGMLASNKLIIPNPRLWNPIGFGDPNLYDFTFTLEKNGIPVASHTHKMGIRLIRLERTNVTDKDGHGEFQIYCNDQKIFIRGTNWKPTSPFHSQLKERNPNGLQLALDCNCNCIRVWGGGTYEDDSFYNFCDEHGLLVWHDFMLACEFPPRDDFFLKSIQTEAKAVLERLRNHASIALWCGDNEDDMCTFWGNFAPRNIRPSMSKVSRQILNDAVLDYAPHSDYLPSSPFVDDSVLAPKRLRRVNNDDTLAYLPEQHIYLNTPRNPAEYRIQFRDCAAHFSSEIGPILYCAPSESPDLLEPEWARLAKYWDWKNPDTIPLENDCIHQTDRYAAVWCQEARNAIQTLFGRTFTVNDLKTDVMPAVSFAVAHLFKFVMEDWRTQKFRRTGLVWWSLLDMWPMGFNYSAVDCHGRRKLCFETLRQSQQPFALMVRQPLDANSLPVLYAVNDTALKQSFSYTITDDEGKVLVSGSSAAEVNDVTSLGSLDCIPGKICFISWKCADGTQGKNFFIWRKDSLDFGYIKSKIETIRNL